MARYLNELNIQSFRGIKNLQLTDFNDINLLTGDNNCGKTSVLEVINYLSGVTDLRNLIYGSRRMMSSGSVIRDLTEYERLSFVFPVDENKISYSFLLDNQPHHVDISKSESIETLNKNDIKELNFRVHLSNEDEVIDVKKMKLNFDVDGLKEEKFFYDFSRSSYSNSQSSHFIETLYVSPFKHVENIVNLNKILNNPDLYEEMLEVLKEFDEGILSLNISTLSETSHSRVVTVLSKEHNQAIPLNFYGDGMKKAILLMSSVIVSENGILLLDEFETAIHTTAMEKVFEWILKTCLKLNVQLFLTSHSKEAIDKVLKCSEDLKKYINLYTLYKSKERNLIRKLTCEEAIEASDSFGLELR